MKFKAKRPYQNDGYNCGVFVMYFMYCYGNGITMAADFNLQTFRKNVAQILLQKSLKMRDTCLYCFLCSSVVLQTIRSFNLYSRKKEIEN